MHKAQKRLAKEIRNSDAVIEMRDARLPMISGNPELGNIISGRKRLILLNKSSLSHPGSNRAWQEYFHRHGLTSLFIDADSRSGLNLIFPPLKNLLSESGAKYRRRGIRPPMPRLMVVGMPNVGKSTFINRLIRENRLKTAPTPGVTRGVQWVQLKNEYLLMDSPGVMLPRITSDAVAHRLGWINAIRDSIIGPERLVETLLDWLSANHAEAIEYYGLPGTGEEFRATDWLLGLCEKRGFLLGGGHPDLQRGAEVVLQDFRNGKLGRFTLEENPSSQ
jgi:ribosome biogenesis GTPase A